MEKNIFRQANPPTDSPSRIKKGVRPMTALNFFTGLFFMFIPSLILASPLPPVYGVNHQTKECAEFFMGDECVACRLPDGWVVIGRGMKNLCPGGYKTVKVRSVCFPQKNPFCCSKGHSGAPGNCKDLVINEKEKKCAFLDNIEKCRVIPEGWQRPRGENVCPFEGYRWLGNLLTCLDEFAPPMINGMRVDWCLSWGTDCGQAAADYYCQKEGYARAETWHMEKVEPTFMMGDGKTCSGKGRCDGFSFIRCVDKKRTAAKEVHFVLDSLKPQIENILKQCLSDAIVDAKGTTLIAQCDTRKFKIPPEDIPQDIEMKGWSSPSGDVIPNPKGIVIELSVLPGEKSMGQKSAGSFRKKYWNLYRQDYPIRNRDEHIWIELYYGKEVDMELLKRIKAIVESVQ